MAVFSMKPAPAMSANRDSSPPNGQSASTPTGLPAPATYWCAVTIAVIPTRTMPSTHHLITRERFCAALSVRS